MAQNAFLPQFLFVTQLILAGNDSCGLEILRKNVLKFDFKLRMLLEYFTADVSTEGADRKFLFWDVSKEFPISLSVLHRFT
jgi:hypothetical protein